MDVPFTRTFHGDVMHYEIVKTDSVDRPSGKYPKYYANITCITPTGKIKTYENYELEPYGNGLWQYNKVVKEGKYYTNNGLMYVFAIIIFLISLLIFIGSTCDDAWNDIDMYFDRYDIVGRRTCRNLRGKHMLTFETFMGLNKSDREIMTEAYEMFKKRTAEMKYVTIPTYAETIDELNSYVDKIEMIRKQKETGIADGTRS